jgi:uncharacterized protein (DUF488 family)
MKKIYTIGHSTRDIDDFISILLKNKIQYVIDVRSYPGSTRYPQYNKDNLRQSLANNNIKYANLLSLGGRRRDKISYKTKIEVKAFSSYAEYMLTNEFRKGINKLIKISQKYTTVFMCSEAVWWSCHRRMISDQLELLGYEVYHLGMGKKPLHHIVWNLARLNSKKQVIYDL